MERNEIRAIDANKLTRDLKGIKDMLVAAGDPFLASVINRALQCVENQPTLELGEELAAAMAYISTMADCDTCKHKKSRGNVGCITADWDCCNCDIKDCKCINCTGGKNWEWRGKQWLN